MSVVAPPKGKIPFTQLTAAMLTPLCTTFRTEPPAAVRLHVCLQHITPQSGPPPTVTATTVCCLASFDATRP